MRRDTILTRRAITNLVDRPRGAVAVGVFVVVERERDELGVVDRAVALLHAAVRITIAAVKPREERRERARRERAAEPRAALAAGRAAAAAAPTERLERRGELTRVEPP